MGEGQRAAVAQPRRARDTFALCACALELTAAVPAPPLRRCSAPVIASQLLLVDEVLRAGMNMRRGPG